MKKLAIIGLGNMGQAILKGLLGSKILSIDAIQGFEKIDTVSKKIRSEFGIAVEKDYSLLSDCDYIVIAVKPQQINDLLTSIKESIKNQVIISIAAGIKSDQIKNVLGDKKIVRAMPNTPALIGEGITGAWLSPNIKEMEKNNIERILQSLGDVIFVDKEEDIDRITALSGSGPAYVYFLMEAFIDAGVYLGLPRDISRKLVLKTFSGSSALSQKTDRTVTELKEMVTSPGGTTIYGLSELENGAVKATIIKAVVRAFERAKELGGR